MKFVLQLLAIGLGSLLAQLFLPWWSIAPVAFVFGYALKSSQNFLAGFLAVALLWSGYAYMLDAGGAAPLAEGVAAIIKVSKPALFGITALVGGLVGGFAATTGALLKSEKRKNPYY